MRKTLVSDFGIQIIPTSTPVASITEKGPLHVILPVQSGRTETEGIAVRFAILEAMWRALKYGEEAKWPARPAEILAEEVMEKDFQVRLYGFAYTASMSPGKPEIGHPTWNLSLEIVYWDPSRKNNWSFPPLGIVFPVQAREGFCDFLETYCLQQLTKLLESLAVKVTLDDFEVRSIDVAAYEENKSAREVLEGRYVKLVGKSASFSNFEEKALTHVTNRIEDGSLRHKVQDLRGKGVAESAMGVIQSDSENNQTPQQRDMSPPS